jgi:hypothetical protein
MWPQGVQRPAGCLLVEYVGTADKDFAYFSPLKEPHGLKCLLYVRYFILESCETSLRVDLHELVLATMLF